MFTRHKSIVRKAALFVAMAGLAVGLGDGASARADLVGHWNFDGNVADQSGYNNHGVLSGAVYSANVPAALGGGMSLDFAGGTNNVAVAANASLNSSTFTLGMFINNRGQASGINRLFSRGGDSFEFGINRALGPNLGQLAFHTAGWRLSSSVPPLNTWQHVALVSEGGWVKLHVNGGMAPVFAVQNVPAPVGNLRIGARENGGASEGFNGLIDDVGLWSEAITPQQLRAASQMGVTGLLLAQQAGFDSHQVTVKSDTSTWMMSTDTEDGGLNGPWTPSGNPVPALGTFTLPAPTIHPARTNITNAAAAMGVGSIGASTNVHFYRTTFELDSFLTAEAAIQIAVDNGAQIYLNGQLIATETSYVVDNWSYPLPSLVINADGTISNVVKFDSSDLSALLMEGTNEIIVAVRNPNQEDPALAGGFAFRMDVLTTIPEPATGALALLAAAAGLRRGRRNG